MEDTNKTKFCPNCGNQLNGEKFCPNCGHNTKNSNISSKINTEDISILFKRLEGKAMGYIEAIISVIFVLMLFSNWFSVSLGEIGNYIASNFGVSLDGHYSVVTLLPGLIKLGKLSGESTALACGMVFSIILIIVALFLAGYSISAVRNVFNNKDNTETVDSLCTSGIVLASVGIAGVWILKILIKSAMEEWGLGFISSTATSVVAFTKTPIIMLVMCIAGKMFYSSSKKKAIAQIKNEYDHFSDSRLIVLYISEVCALEDRAIIREILGKRNIDLEKKRKQYNYISDLYADKTDSELSEIITTISEDDLNKEIAKEILNARKQMKED